MEDFHFLRNKNTKKMNQSFDSPIEELKHYLTRQIEAYHKNDTQIYDELEVLILKVEKKL